MQTRQEETFVFPGSPPPSLEHQKGEKGVGIKPLKDYRSPTSIFIEGVCSCSDCKYLMSSRCPGWHASWLSGLQLASAGVWDRAVRVKLNSLLDWEPLPERTEVAPDSM